MNICPLLKYKKIIVVTLLLATTECLLVQYKSSFPKKYINYIEKTCNAKTEVFPEEKHTFYMDKDEYNKLIKEKE